MWRFVGSRAFHVAEKGGRRRGGWSTAEYVTGAFSDLQVKRTAEQRFNFVGSSRFTHHGHPLIPNLRNVTVNRPVSPFLLITRVSALIASRPAQRVRYPVNRSPTEAQRNRTKQFRVAEFKAENFVFGHAEFPALSFSFLFFSFFLSGTYD